MAETTTLAPQTPGGQLAPETLHEKTNENQSTADKNEETVKSKIDHGEPISKQEASTVESYESRTHMGGARPPSGSTAAVAQSSVDKHANFVAAAQETAAKIQTDPTSVTAADANHLESLEAHDMGSARPRKDSISAEAKRVASANEGHRSVSAAITKGPDPVHAAQVAREKEYAEAIAVIQPKMVNDPKSVTQEDAALLQSSEVRARGQVEKGGIASQALHLAAANQSGEKGR